VADLEALAVNAVIGISPAELHGAVCGIAVASGEAFHIHQLIDLVGLETVTDSESVGAFVQAALTELLADDFRFVPLLPDDETPLAERAEALVQWCSAFTSGVAAGVAFDDQPPDLSKEAEGILNDMLAISNLDADLDADEDSEFEMVELTEFVKVGTLLLLNLVKEGDTEGD
jgi:uncharacterized protein YgfB (UPF0149 family)